MNETLFERSQLINETNVRKTKSLFWEHRKPVNDKLYIKPLMCLSADNTEASKGLVCIRDEYMKFDTEYNAAMWIIGDWVHWKKLCECSWFKEAKESWDDEKAQKIKDMAKQTLIDSAATGNVPAAKLLYENKKPRATTRGRPSTAEKKALLNSEVKHSNKVSDITKRMKKFEDQG